MLLHNTNVPHNLFLYTPKVIFSRLSFVLKMYHVILMALYINFINSYFFRLLDPPAKLHLNATQLARSWRKLKYLTFLQRL